MAHFRILLVDDEPLVRDMCSHLLRKAGYEIEEAADGRSACDAIEQRRFDAVITDLALPLVDGIQVLKAVRERDPDLPVVLMTGSGDLGTAMQAVEHGALGYLLKPISPSVLLTVAEKAVAYRRQAVAKRRALDHYGDVTRQESVRAELSATFDRALTTLHMVYQPIVRFSDRSVFAYEALVRTDEPALRSPSDLFAAAEALGRVMDIGRATRRSVASTLPLLSSSVPVFVNLHPSDLEDDDLLSGSSPLSKLASRIVLEVTERASLEATTNIHGRLRALRGLGYRLAVDDLGAGYSGLASLALLAPEVVKIDMSLTRGVDREPTKQKVIETLATLCRDLGLLAIVEGVETADERDALIFLGCDLLQGYLFARPASSFPTATWGSRQLARLVPAGFQL